MSRSARRPADARDSVDGAVATSRSSDPRDSAVAGRPERVLVIVPTYCERENVTALTEGLIRACPSADLLFVDDNSPDGTGQVIDDLAAGHRQVHVLHRPRKAGLGRAYVAGFRWALERGYPLVVAMDADLSHDPRDVPHLLTAAAHADVVLGSRYMDGATLGTWPFARALLSRAARVYVRAVTGIPFSDPTGGFKCYRREVLASLDLEGITSNGFAFQVEIAHCLWQAGFRVAEVPITFNDRRAGRSKISCTIALEGAWRVWDLRFRGRSGRPIVERRPPAALQRLARDGVEEDSPIA